ncbi:DUF3592 domain-containing protein [Clostridium paraputrificum]|uniref:DUF3592 domain-containing protein n=1 Tax=Clostridium TaxID=1485 RepID=UPI003D32F8A1
MVIFLLITLSIILLAIGLGMLYSKMRLKRDGIRAVGKVIRNEKYIESTVDSYNGLVPITLYRPIIEFKTKDGMILQGICEEGSNPPEFEEGEEVNIIYPSNDPEGFILKSSMDSVELPITCISISIIMLVFAIVLIFI